MQASGLQVSTLDNGLTLAVLKSRRAPIVTTVLWLRVGAAHEGETESGSAHFLEHMMFKGSASYGAGEIDRLTQALGGTNNAFTGHDSTTYHFQFAADRWPPALEMEADRMAGLLFAPVDFQNERQVILEEIAMYESEPWNALEVRVRQALFGQHPYCRPVLGNREELLAMGADCLRRFHDRYYCPRNAVLVVAGDVDNGVEALVERTFGSLQPGEVATRVPKQPVFPASQERVELRRGEVSRFLLSLPAPAASDADHPRLRLLLYLLTVGRSSLLHRTLVEEEQLCAWVSGDLSDSLDPGSLNVAVELLPGAEAARLEGRLFELLEEVRQGPIDDRELARAKQVFRADWVFAHERIYQQALMAGSALAHHDAEFPERYRRQIADCDGEDLRAMASRYLELDSGVVGWCRPK